MIRTLIFFFSLLCTYTFSQVTYFQSVFGDSAIYNEAREVTTAMNGDFLISGTRGDSAFLMRMNPDGILQWSKLYALDSAVTHAYSITELPNGDIVTVGTDFHFCRFSSTGTLLVARKFAVQNAIFNWAGKVLLTTDGNLLIGGHVYRNSGMDIQLLKTDTSGNIIWQSFAGRNSFYSEYFMDMIETNDSSVVVAARSSSTSGIQSVILFKYSKAGNLIWMKESNQPGDLYVYGVIENNNTYYLATYDGLNNYSATVVDTAGNFVKEIVFDNNTILYLYEMKKFDNDIVFTGLNVVVDSVSGASELSGVALSVDTNFNLQWSKKFRPNSNVALNHSAGGSANSLLLLGRRLDSKQVYLIKTDKFGNGTCFDDAFNISISNDSCTFNSFTASLSYSVNMYNSTGFVSDYGGINTICSFTGIGKKQALPLKVIPNPADDYASITLNAYCSGNFSLFDQSGRKIISSDFAGKIIDIGTQFLEQGLYFFKVMDSTGEVFNTKIIVQH